MTQQITKSETRTAIDPVNLRRSRPGFLGWCKNGLTVEMGEATIYEDRAPSETQRQNLSQRVEQLKAALEPSVDGAAMRMVLAMLAAMPAQNGDTIDLQLRGEAYRMALDDLPAWAIERQAKQVIRGETKLPRTFAPTPAAFREVVSDSLADLRNELELIEILLSAKSIPAPPDIYRPRQPGDPTYAEIVGKPGSAGDFKSPFTPELMADLAARKAKRESSPFPPEREDAA